ncbi:MAG: hypothetical protein E7179_01015 [Erysipelotrichaceae bacterium]|jgi:hypothetical protein|nr:hypothetical protein [Erysipelotrichaceae bacterium]
MKRKQATLLTLVGVSALGLLAMVVGTHGRQLIPSFAEPKDYDRNIGPTQFAGCTFEDYTFGGKTDSKAFTYQMEDGKYMEGAILYGDCDHQSVGATLSQSFVLDNSDQGGANHADFHIFFSAQGITSASFSFDVELDKAPEVGQNIHVQASLKSSTLFSNGLYSGLSGEASYSNITQGSGAFYNAGSGSRDFYLTNASKKLEDCSKEITDIKSANAVAFQVNAFNIPAGRTLTITLKSVTIKYTC